MIKGKPLLHERADEPVPTACIEVGHGLSPQTAREHVIEPRPDVDIAKRFRDGLIHHTFRQAQGAQPLPHAHRPLAPDRRLEVCRRPCDTGIIETALLAQPRQSLINLFIGASLAAQAIPKLSR